MLADDAFFASGSGVNGLCAIPWCCLDVPSVVSETGWFGFAGAWLTAMSPTAAEAPAAADAVTGVGAVEEPPPSTA